MPAVFKRELKSYFNTVTGELFVAVNLFFLGIYFTAYHLNMGSSHVSYTVQSVLLVFMIVTPVLTMRSMAEERRQRTDQLLFTAPVSAGKIILGKYLGMVGVFLVPVLVLCLYPVILGRFGHVPMAESYVAILGYFLFGCACISIGLFISSMTENLIIASVGTFGILFLSYLMSGIRSLISESGNTLTEVLKAFDIASPLNGLMQGRLEILSLIYYISVVFLMLFFTHQNVNRRRYEFNKTTAKLSIFSWAGTIIVTAVVVGLNIGATFLPDEYKSFDVTEEKLYEITDTTKDYLGSLTEDVTINVLGNREGYDDTIAKILDRYATYPKVKVEYVDTAVNPDFSKQYGVEQATEGSLIVVSGKRSKYVHYSDLYETEVDYQTYQQKTTGIDAEGQITAAIDYVLTDDIPTVYMVTGHNEVNLSSTVSSLLEKANIEVKEINLMRDGSVPEDAQALFILAPTKDFSADDVKAVKEYLNKGGNAFIISSYNTESMAAFNGIMEDYGVKLVDGIVVEGNDSDFYQNPTYLLPELEYDTATASLISDKRVVLMPYAQGAIADNGGNDALKISTLLKTSDKAYAKKNTQNAQSLEKEEGDADGPFTVGLMAEKELDSGSSKILYFTSESILDDSINTMVSGANSELIMKGLSGMISEKESSIVIPAKKYSEDSIVVPRSTALLCGLLMVGFVPLFILICGIVIWSRRRKL